MVHKRSREAQARRRKEKIEKQIRPRYPPPPRVIPAWYGKGTKARSPIPNWIKDLFHPERLSYGSDWPRQRYRALERDNFTCRYEGCSETEKLHVHHIVKYRISKNNNLDNLITLCEKHHPVIESCKNGA